MITEAIIVALVTGCFTLIGVLISNSKADAIVQTQIEELTREVREHNNFAKRMPVVENEINNIKEDIKEIKQGK